MSSALKPVLTPAPGTQNSPVPTQLNKPMHSQSTSATYGQPMSHIPQNLVNIPHTPPTSSHSNTHCVTHHANAHPTNHYSLNVPNASQHYPISGNAPGNSHSTMVNNHPTSNNSAHTQPSTTFSTPAKNISYNQSYSSGHSYKSVNVTPTQNTTPTTQTTTVVVEAPTTVKSEANGASKDKAESRMDTPQNYAAVKEKPSHSSTSLLPEEPKPFPEKPKLLLSNEEPSATQQTPNKDVKTSETTITMLETVENKAVTQTSASILNVEQVSVVEVCNTTEAKIEPQHSQATSASVVTTVETPCGKQPSPEVTNIEPEKIQETSENVTSLSTVQNKPKEQINNQKSTLKLATTPRVPLRKPKTVKSELMDTSRSPSKTETKSPTQKSPSSLAKSKRNRTKTQPYQSPLPEVEMISKISATPPRNRNTEDKLTLFYKNEFLAVRNSEGSFYVCQAMQNIYKSSPRIKIRWLSQDKTDKEIYTPDFYDYTDFDCILTNLNLGRVDKGKYKLPSNERIRTDSILKRALDVEKGDATPPSLTEEHPDGLDISLYKEESQLKKKKAVKRKATTPLVAPTKTNNTKKLPDQAKRRKIISKQKEQTVKKSTVLKKALAAKVKKLDIEEVDKATKRKKPDLPNNAQTKTTPIIDQKKTKVLAKVARKPPIEPPLKIQPLSKQNIKNVKPTTSSAKKPIMMKKEKPIITRKSKRGRK